MLAEQQYVQFILLEVFTKAALRQVEDYVKHVCIILLISSPHSLFQFFCKYLWWR